MLADGAASGVFVIAHPDVIAKMDTKEVLFRTRSLGWLRHALLSDVRDDAEGTAGEPGTR
jgi:hypothetical protein